MIAPHMQAIELPLKLTLVEQDEPNETICFLERGLASVVAITTEDEIVEVGHIGSEGATGLHTALHANQSPSHEFLSLMLGVRRSGVTDNLHILEGMRAIKATRGRNLIRDRAKLEETPMFGYSWLRKSSADEISSCTENRSPSNSSDASWV
jgi:hypothetical protein